MRAVEQFLYGTQPDPPPAEEATYQLGPAERQLIDTKLRLGRLLDSLGRRDEAVAEWRHALRVDPELRHPQADLAGALPREVPSHD